ncbi:hypothetical protein ANCDUO_07987 [Ancylostoma duodenale]|uniref:Uncharacterized protein n=1 Tax=Ancylostoma duodenale TaxID=51022 RepID=A0A0C2GKH9_9BILA|nr:hypothetical protein ANCDUO_07987 [Ancylostoma duodenale]
MMLPPMSQTCLEVTGYDFTGLGDTEQDNSSSVKRSHKCRAGDLDGCHLARLSRHFPTALYGYDVHNASAICARLSNDDDFDEINTIVEKDIASMKIYLQIACSVPTFIMAPVIGTWSDKKGFTGGVGSMFGTSLTIVTDDCRNKLKPVSVVLSPDQRETVSEVVNRVENGGQHSHASPSGSADIQVEQPKSLATKLRDNVYAIGEVLLQKRPGWTRCCLIMSLFFVMVEFLALGPLLLTLVHWLGKDSLMIIIGIAASAVSFFLIAAAHTTEEIFLTTVFTIFCGAIGPGYRSFLPRMVPKEQTARLLTSPLLLTLVHWLGKDSLMIIIGIAASAVSFFLIAAAHTTEEIFLTTVFTIFCGAIGPGYRSFLPRMVPKEQTARLLTICSMIMAFCPMMSAAVFNSIFTASMEWWPGFAFFVGGALQLLVVIGQG